MADAAPAAAIAAAPAANRRVIWTEQDDINLTNCYLSVSGDAITGTGQRADTFWARIRGHFLSLSENRAGHPERCVSLLFTGRTDMCT
jgi:hypothetical protein